ncbi:MAG: hypothetical protein HQK54_14675, partial [Oligoflexales bacterium]|nr:hypothetical protein [Oligoflexales bacterium]
GGCQPHAVCLGKSHCFRQKRDLPSPISFTQAHAEIARITAAFIDFHSGIDNDAFLTLKDYSIGTGIMLRPLIEAMELEGSHHLKPPCNTKGADQANCWSGSKWSALVSPMMGGSIRHVKYESFDEFHEVWRMFPFFHPRVYNTCSLDQKDCVLRLKTITQNVYEYLESYDIGFSSPAALEMRVKMKSRQLIRMAAGFEKEDFEKTDSFDICAQINQTAIDWAVYHASQKVRNRYIDHGIPMVVGKDIGPFLTGPRWIWTPLSMKTVDRGGKLVREVRSPTMRTSVDLKIKGAGGQHYCKLLSPFRAIEWVYIDSLRQAQ